LGDIAKEALTGFAFIMRKSFYCLIEKGFDL
jgi:hypothetical protein